MGWTLFIEKVGESCPNSIKQIMPIIPKKTNNKF